MKGFVWYRPEINVSSRRKGEEKEGRGWEDLTQERTWVGHKNGILRQIKGATACKRQCVCVWGGGVEEGIIRMAESWDLCVPCQDGIRDTIVKVGILSNYLSQVVIAHVGSGLSLGYIDILWDMVRDYINKQKMFKLHPTMSQRQIHL